MHKLCTLKDVVPGSVVELPEAYRSRAGEMAVILGLECQPGDMVRTQFLKPGSCDVVGTPSLSENTPITVTDDAMTKDASIQAFLTRKFKLPALGMSLGCDPEIFAVHGNGTIFPAWEYMPNEETALATAKDWKLLGYGDTAGIVCPEVVPAYWDGAQAEFAPWGKSCLEVLHYGTRTGLKAVLDRARMKDAKARLTLQNVVELPEAVLRDTDDKFIQFRCSQSHNVYNDPGDVIQNAREYKYRCAGGHVHIGLTRRFTAPAIEQIVRGLDGVLGVAGVSLAAGIDNPERRHTYGRAGEFRLPQHGLEYRVLSNFWLSHPAIAMLVFELARATVRLAESGLFNLCWNAREQETREVINNCDVDGARKVLARNIAVLQGMLDGVWAAAPAAVGAAMRAFALETILGGMDVAIKEPFQIEKNWKIDEPEGWKAHCRGANDSWQSLTELRA
jgi:Phage phiEco32-like COOH.NH2 ligase-type 2